jgi:urease accessory protein
MADMKNKQELMSGLRVAPANGATATYAQARDTGGGLSTEECRGSPLRLEHVIGHASDPEIADRLHHLSHEGRIEVIMLAPEDVSRHRLRIVGDKGTEFAIALPRSEHLENGAVLMLDEQLAVMVQVTEQQWLRLEVRDAAAGLELGYFAGNMHWAVRFNGATLEIALQGPEQDYLDRLAHLLADGRVRRAADD